MNGTYEHLFDNRGNEVPILVWCGECRRYISHEAAHHCDLSRDEWKERTIARRLKVGLERTRAA